MTRTPDNWTVLKMPTCYKLLAGWSGGYTTGSSWSLNSGIIKVVDDGTHWLFYGHSGSVYRCHKEANEVRMNIANVMHQLLEAGSTEVPEDTDWANFDWSVK